MADPLRKLESAVKKLATDMSSLRFGGMRGEMDEMHSIMQLGVGSTHEVRISRLESAVFGTKH